jgi:hypothetical protein
VTTSLRIRQAYEPFKLPDNALCLSKTGWHFDQTELVYVQLQAGMTLEQAMVFIAQQYVSLLGPGEIVFECIEEAPVPKGYIVHYPQD